MTTPNERDEFERIRSVAQIERARSLVARYEEHQEFCRRQIEDSRYDAGESNGSAATWRMWSG